MPSYKVLANLESELSVHEVIRVYDAPYPDQASHRATQELDKILEKSQMSKAKGQKRLLGWRIISIKLITPRGATPP